MAADTILCMYSGGIDSSGVLHQLFSASAYKDKPLIIHHIILQNRENRAQAEMASVTKIIEYYQQNHADRKFTYTQSLIDTTGFAPLQSSRFPFDMDICAFIAANLCVAQKDIRYVAMGRTKTDIESGGNNFGKRMERAQGIFRSVYALEPEILPEYIFPVMDMTKNEIWDTLPQAVQDNSWYCRHPQYDTSGDASACGQCATCNEVQVLIKNA